jgi:hypothetical protein
MQERNAAQSANWQAGYRGKDLDSEMGGEHSRAVALGNTSFGKKSRLHIGGIDHLQLGKLFHSAIPPPLRIVVPGLPKRGRKPGGATVGAEA